MFDKMLACHFLAPDAGIEVVRHAADDCVGIAPAMGAMTEEAVGGSDELRTEAAPGIPVWTGLGLE